MKRHLLFITLFFFAGCSGEQEQPAGRKAGNSGDLSPSSVSPGFTSAGCGNSSCHGPEGNQGFNLLHDASGNPITNLTKSERNLDSWRRWIRLEAKSPMPRFSADQYSDAHLEHDYRVLTGRSH